jgi:hypothetical protein
MWPFKGKKSAQAAEAPIEFHRFDGDPAAERVERAMRQRDWATVREIFAGPITPRQRTLYLRLASDVTGLQDWIDDLVRAEPDSTLPLLVKGSHAIHWAWEIRGSGRASTVPQEAWPIFRKRLKLAEDTLDAVLDRDPKDSDALAQLITLGSARSLGIDEVRRRFANAIAVDPLHMGAHSTMLQQVCRKWSGSSAEMFEFARSRAALGPGTSLPMLIADAHIEEWLDNDRESEYFEQAEVGDELVAAAHQSIWHPDYRPVGGSPNDLNHFAMAFALADRFTEAQRCFDVIGEHLVTRFPWSYYGDSTAMYRKLRRYVASSAGS